MNPVSTTEDAAKSKKKEYAWIVLGIPLGWVIGVAMRNLQVGFGIGMILVATVLNLRIKKEERKFGLIVQITILIVGSVLLSLGIIFRG
jgi:hypothetical protein